MHTRMSLLFIALLACVACSRDNSEAPATPAASTAAAPAAASTAAPATAAVKQSVFSREELDQMVAPLALYPDPLLAQVLMAATYPGDVADAAAWSKANPKAQGDAAVRQVADQPWDPSVQSLVAFPQALAVLGQDPGWVQRLGDAFLAQPDDVMDAVQRLRRQAQAAGNLESNEYQKVTEVAPQAAPAEPAPAVGGATTTEYVESTPDIVIQPSDPQTVYVPSYNPQQVYGTWAYPSYPPPYYPPSSAWYPMGGALASGLAFGVGLAITDSLWGDCDWGGGDVDINVNRYNNINTNRQISNGNWQHNSLNRDGVPYRDNYNREMNGNRLAGAENRDAFRGDNAERTRSREQARSSMQDRGLNPARDNAQARASSRDTMDRATPQQRERAQAAAQERGGAQSRDAQRERAQATQRDRTAQAQQRDRAQSQQRAQQNRQPQRSRQSQSNAQARSSAQRQAQANRAPSNNAFSGAGGRSQQQHAASQRGQRSSASAQRPQQQRSQGHQVNRQPQQRSGGHQQASRSSGGSRQPSSGGGRRR